MFKGNHPQSVSTLKKNQFSSNQTTNRKLPSRFTAPIIQSPTNKIVKFDQKGKVKSTKSLAKDELKQISAKKVEYRPPVASIMIFNRDSG